jgi:hypothetical protein
MDADGQAGDAAITTAAAPGRSAGSSGPSGSSGSSARIAALGSRLRRHLPEILLYCAIRALGVIVLAAMAAHPGDLSRLLTKWDGQWYLGVARHGYDTALSFRPDGALVNTNIVFFPLYPLLVRAVGAVVGLVAASLLISLVSGLAAAVAMRSIGEHLYDRRTGILLAGLWGLLPTAVVESMAYTESLYTALAAFTVLFLLRRQWIAAGVAALLAGLTHPTGAAAAATVGICALITVVRRRDGIRPWIGGLIAPLGALGYLAWVGVALHHWNGFTYMEEHGWDSTPSLIGVARQIRTTLTHQQPLGYYVPVFVLAGSLLCAAALSTARHRASALPLAVQAFGWISLALALFVGPVYFHAEARFLMPDFPLLLPPATRLAAERLRSQVVLLACAALASAWYGGYLLTVWTHSP